MTSDRTAPTEGSHEHTSSGGGQGSSGRNLSKDSESRGVGMTSKAFNSLQASSALATSTHQLQPSVRKPTQLSESENTRFESGSGMTSGLEGDVEEDAKSDDTIRDDLKIPKSKRSSVSNQENLPTSENQSECSDNIPVERKNSIAEPGQENQPTLQQQKMAVSHQSVQLKSMHGLHGGLFAGMQHETSEKDTSELHGDEERPVISGGKRIGWLPEVAAAMWHRLLGMLGNINNVQDSEVYRRIFNHLLKMFKDLERIRDNRGVCFDNCFTPDPPELMPPLQVFIPWCFQAIVHKSEVDVKNYKSGLILACELLARSISVRQDCPLNEEQILLFYYIFQLELDKALRAGRERKTFVFGAQN